MGGWGPLEPGHIAIVMPVPGVTRPGPIAITFVRAARTDSIRTPRRSLSHGSSSSVAIRAHRSSRAVAAADPARRRSPSSLAVRVRTPGEEPSSGCADRRRSGVVCNSRGADDRGDRAGGRTAREPGHPPGRSIADRARNEESRSVVGAPTSGRGRLRYVEHPGGDLWCLAAGSLSHATRFTFTRRIVPGPSHSTAVGEIACRIGFTSQQDDSAFGSMARTGATDAVSRRFDNAGRMYPTSLRAIGELVLRRHPPSLGVRHDRFGG